MSHGAAIVIVFGCIAVALVISAPFLVIARRRRLKRNPSASGHVPLRELPALFAYVVVMFYGFAQAHTEPNSWFGQKMSTDVGRIAFLVGPALLVTAARVAWLSFRRARDDTTSS